MTERLKNFLFGEQSTRQTFIKNSFWSTVSSVGSNLLKLFIVIYAARALGAEEYGLFSYALSLAAIFTILSDLGLNQLFFLNIARRDESEDAYYPTLILLRLGLIFAVVILTILIGPVVTKFPEAKVLLPIVALLAASDDIRAFLSGIVRAQNRIDKEALGHIFTNVLIAIFAITGLRESPTSYELASAYFVGSAVGTLLMLVLVWKNLKNIFPRFSFSPSLAKSILAVAIPFGLANIMWPLMTHTDALVVGWLRTAAELGHYAAAQRPVTALSLIPTVIAASSLALIARAAKDGAGERLRLFVERLITLSLSVVLPMALGGIIVAPAMIEFLYGTEYMPAVLSFQLLLITLVISFPSSVVTNLVLAFKQQKSFAMAMAMGAVGNFILDLILVPPFGIAGSVVATIGALGIINGYMWGEAKKLQPFNVLPFLPKIFAATLLMGLLTFTLHLAEINFLLNIALSALAYFAILLALREPLLKEVKGILSPR